MLCTVLSEVTKQATSVLMYLQPIARHYAMHFDRHASRVRLVHFQ